MDAVQTQLRAEQPTALYDALTAQEPQNGKQALRPSAIPVPVPVPALPFGGSRFLIWKQDPSVPLPGARIVFIPTLILDGPRDNRITTNLPGITPVHANMSRDFLFIPGTHEFHCAHTFAVARSTLTMCQRILHGLPLPNAHVPWAWNVGGDITPLTVHPRAAVGANAYYSRSQRSLKFFYFKPTATSPDCFTCESLDIVSHECGHAVLDGLKPGWLSAGNPPQTGGLHESFGDLCALFLACSQLDQVEAAIAHTKGDLHKAEFLKHLAEQFGMKLGFPEGLRNADNDLKLSQVSNEVHALSQVFTGAIYDVMADIYIFERIRQFATKDPSWVLLEVAANLCSLVLRAMLDAPATGATYADVANKMLELSHNQHDPVIYRTFIRNRFTLREIVVSPTPLAASAMAAMRYDDPNFAGTGDVLKLEAQAHVADRAPQDRAGCCGTMQLPEYVVGDPKKLSSGESVTEGDLLLGMQTGMEGPPAKGLRV